MSLFKSPKPQKTTAPAPIVNETPIINENILTDKVNEIEIQNQKLENTKKAMLNLLEDARKLEGQLQSERDRAKAIISTMGEGLIVLDDQHRIILINPTAQRLLDITDTECQGKTWFDIVKVYEGEKEIPPDQQTIAKAASSKETIYISLKDNHFYKTISGKIIPVISVTTPIPVESGSGVVKVFKDATYEKKEKEIIENLVQERTQELQNKNVALLKAQSQISEGWFQLQREKAKLTASLNSLSLGFTIVDMQNQILFINPSAQSILGMTKTPSLLQEIASILAPTCDLDKLHKKCYTEKTSSANTFFFNNKYIILYLTPIILSTTDQKEYIGTAILIQDVTESKIVERSKDEFFSIASHELRTPLTAIRGNIGLILEYYKEKLSDPDLLEMLNDIHESSVRLIGIVNDFLNISRLEQRKIEFKKSQFDLTSLLKSTIKELEPSSQDKPLYLKLADDNTPPYQINSDSDRLKEVLINLIGNSIKYTEKGGITVDIKPINNTLKVTVTDTGRGIPIAQQPLLFRKFQQAGESLLTRDTSKGTGLGLYISKLLIEGLGGQVGLEKSEPGIGSTFYFTLPLTP